MKRGLVLHVHGRHDDSLAGPIQVAANARAQLPDIPIEIVLQGPVVAIATSSTMSEDLLERISHHDVTVMVCANSLRGQGIDASELARGLVSVPAAV